MGKQGKIRLDELLVERGEFADVDEVLRAVVAGEVRVGDSPASSAAVLVSPDEDVRVKGRRRFVSRGGLKLQAALDAFDQDVRGLRCIDVGSSTGGFTDCLLQAGAASVVCVDVNYGQLAWKLRQDERVSVFERTNIRHASPEDLGAPFDFIAIDVSFIGLARLAPVLPPLCRGFGAMTAVDGAEEDAAAGGSCEGEGGPADVADDRHPVAVPRKDTALVALVKPQFESRRGETDHGIVRDETVRTRTVDEVTAALVEQGFRVTGAISSPITGADGNVEYLLHAVYRPRA